MKTTTQPRFKKDDLVFSTVHAQVGTVIDVKWKPNDEQWVATWMYRLDICPNCWMYQSVLQGID